MILLDCNTSLLALRSFTGLCLAPFNSCAWALPQKRIIAAATPLTRPAGIALIFVFILPPADSSSISAIGATRSLLHWEPRNGIRSSRAGYPHLQRIIGPTPILVILARPRRYNARPVESRATGNRELNQNVISLPSAAPISKILLVCIDPSVVCWAGLLIRSHSEGIRIPARRQMT